MCYDFYIVPPASLTGRVMVNLTGLELRRKPGRCRACPNVTVNLLNANSQIVATTVTDSDGDYAFNNLMPGQYSIQELPPASYFRRRRDAGRRRRNDCRCPGYRRGDAQSRSGGDVLRLLRHAAGDDLRHRVPGRPADSGRAGPNASMCLPNRTGVLAAGDPRIAGVTLQLVNGVTGAPILGSQALPGYYNSERADYDRHRCRRRLFVQRACGRRLCA